MSAVIAAGGSKSASLSTMLPSQATVPHNPKRKELPPTQLEVSTRPTTIGGSGAEVPLQLVVQRWDTANRVTTLIMPVYF